MFYKRKKKKKKFPIVIVVVRVATATKTPNTVVFLEYGLSETYSETVRM